MSFDEATTPVEEFPINTLNEYGLSLGQNLDNHSTALAGRAKFVRQSDPTVPTFRTQQAAFRYAAYLVSMAMVLPHEEGEHEFEEVLDAIRNA